MKDDEKLLEKEALRILVMLAKCYGNVAKAVDPELALEILKGVENAEKTLTEFINTKGENTHETLL